jgi:peptidoglycan/xylan/chitin deacetylase (PgdA/CDA1 family)
MRCMSARLPVAMGALGAAVAWCGPAAAPLLPPLAAALRVPLRMPLDGAVALTFDDGPHPHGTPAVLEILRAHDAVATFFVVGEQVRRTGGLLDEVLAAGHAVAVHGDRHRTLMRLTPGAVRADLDRAEDVLGGRALAIHRAPYGIYTLPALADVRRRGWQPLLWSRWGHDWRARATPAGVADEVTRRLAPGDVLLLHDADDYSARDSWRTTVAALPRVLERIAEAGLRPAPGQALSPCSGGSTAARTSGARPPSR